MPYQQLGHRKDQMFVNPNTQCVYMQQHKVQLFP